MSSVEGDDLKSLAQFCADFEAAKKKKGSNKEADKEAKAQAARCLPPPLRSPRISVQIS
jgi:hypothetical protein